MAQGAHFPLPEGVFAPYELVRELGARPLPAYAVRAVAAPGAKSHLLVAERFAGCALGPDGKDSDFVREARRIATLTSPNLPRVRDVVVRGPDVIVYTEYVDGEKLAALWRPDGMPLEIALRAIVDVLSGVATLHNLRDARQQPLKLAHGELSPSTIVFGLDGVARLLHAVTRRQPGALPDPASVRTMAPEILTGDPYDQRADVYGAGALLWEALSGKPLLEETDPIAVAARVRAGDLPKATIPASAPWAKDLVGVAAKALSPSPDDRWPNATVMAGELRKAAGLRLAPVSTTAAFAKSAIAERTKGRRQALEAQVAMQPAPAPALAVAAAAAPPAQAPPPTARPAPPIVAPPRPGPPAPSPRPPVAVPAVASPSPPAASPSPPAAVAPAPPPRVETEAPPEDDVLVAPGLRAPVADVVELGSDSLLEASDSVPPAAPASGGAMLDPFALTAGPPHPPPPPPPPAPPPPAPPPPTFEAVAIDPVLQAAPPAAAPPPPFDLAFSPAVETNAATEARPVAPAPAEAATAPRAPFETDPSLARLSEREAVTRRRKVLVLGGVAGLGCLILVLAAVRWATRDTSTHESPRPPVAAQVAPVAPVPPPGVAPTAAAPSATPAATPVPPPPPAAVAAPTVAAVAPPTKPPAAPPVAAARPKPPVPSRPAAAATPRPKKNKPAFDPNTL